MRSSDNSHRFRRHSNQGEQATADEHRRRAEARASPRGLSTAALCAVSPPSIPSGMPGCPTPLTSAAHQCRTPFRTLTHWKCSLTSIGPRFGARSSSLRFPLPAHSPRFPDTAAGRGGEALQRGGGCAAIRGGRACGGARGGRRGLPRLAGRRRCAPFRPHKATQCVLSA